jgi:chromosome transmission fidelity protein 1
MDSICGIYSTAVTLSQLQRGRAQLMIYLAKFRLRLKGKNRVYVAQTVRMLDSVISFLQPKLAKGEPAESVVEISDLMSGKGVDQINLFKLNIYIQESKLARKVDGYTVHIEEEQKAKETPGRATGSEPSFKSTVPVLTHIQAFMLTMMNPSPEGRFIYSKVDNEPTLRYMLLDPTNHFREIVDEARAVVLAGGTMSPMEDYMKHLFSYVPDSRIFTLSCGHIVPPSSLAVYPVTTDRHSQEFNFSFSNRSAKSMITSAGETLLDFVSAIPDGVVIFFSSYSYLSTCIEIWKSTNPNRPTTIWDALNALKPVFLEQRSAPSNATSKPVTHDGESTLSAYTNAIRASTSHQGAILLAVINGSLSEGINFSDELGRAVIVLGLPFPNIRAPDWTAKLRYISDKEAAARVAAGGRSAEARAAGKAAADEFYLNTTMRAVNQAVGRAIRHKGDYAAVLLVDVRYARENIQRKLPGWMKGSMRAKVGVGDIVRGLNGFFAGRI